MQLLQGKIVRFHDSFLAVFFLTLFYPRSTIQILDEDSNPGFSISLIEPPVNASPIFHLVTETNFSFTWTLKVTGEPADPYEVARFIMRKPLSMYVPFSLSIAELSMPFQFLSPWNAVNCCVSSKALVSLSEKHKSGFDYQHIDIELVLPMLNLSCDGVFNLDARYDYETVIDSYLTLKIYEKASFASKEISLEVNDDDSSLTFRATIKADPKPKIVWTCEREDNSVFENYLYENRTHLWVSVDYVSFHRCVNIKCTISNRVCEGREDIADSLSCYTHTASKYVPQKFLRPFSLADLSISESERKPLPTCNVKNDVCKNVFKSEYITQVINRDLLKQLDGILQKSPSDVSDLCKEFVQRLSCSYMFTDSSCARSEELAEPPDDPKFFCKRNLELLDKFCPANVRGALNLDKNLALRNCDRDFLFQNLFPENECDPRTGVENENGRSLWRYSGNRTLTKFGRSCIEWSQIPSKYFHYEKEFLFPEGYLNNNECRHALSRNLSNPGCFVTSFNPDEFVFQSCPVESCLAYPTGRYVTKAQRSTFLEAYAQKLLIAISIMIFFLIIVLAASIFVYYKRIVSRVTLVPISPEVLHRTNVRFHRNPKYDDASSISGGGGSSAAACFGATSSYALHQGSNSGIARKHSSNSKRDSQLMSNYNTNRYSVQSNPTYVRHDSFNSNAGSEKGPSSANRMRPSPSAASEFAFDWPPQSTPLTTPSATSESQAFFNTFGRGRGVLKDIDPRLEYDRNSIQYITDLGTGAFGQVFHALVTDKSNPEKRIEVAVKKLKDGRLPEMRRAFQQEALLLANFSHPNIVKLKGVCSKGSPFCMLMDYMKYGDLHRYLVRCSDGASTFDSHRGRQRPLTATDLLMISQQVASGMSYISEKNYIHRDLATRNCLVGDNLVVKITDFGLSVQLKESSEYVMLEASDGVVPTRWMAPEALTLGRYSRQSDVWSFGVLLWEVFTYAMQPYYDKDNQSIVQYVVGGGVLERVCCDGNGVVIPEDIYQVMLQCWAMQPSRRPPFRSLYEQLDSLLKKYTTTAISAGPPLHFASSSNVAPSPETEYSVPNYPGNLSSHHNYSNSASILQHQNSIC